MNRESLILHLSIFTLSLSSSSLFFCSFTVTRMEAMAHVRHLAEAAPALCELKELEDRGLHFRFVPTATLPALLARVAVVQAEAKAAVEWEGEEEEVGAVVTTTTLFVVVHEKEEDEEEEEW